MASEAAALFERAGDAVVATELTRGPWNVAHAHAGAQSALLAGVIARAAPEHALSRIALDLMSPLELGRALTLEREVVKPGRAVQVIEARLRAGERVVARAVGHLITRRPCDAPQTGGRDAPIGRGVPGSYPGLAFDTTTVNGPQHGFFPDAVDVQIVDGRPGSGRATGWFRLGVPVLADQPVLPIERVLAAADFANGISHRVPLSEWLFINSDLTVHLARDPIGEWICLDARTDLGPDGAGVASAALFDEQGPIGVMAQSLLVARR